MIARWVRSSLSFAVGVSTPWIVAYFAWRFLSDRDEIGAMVLLVSVLCIGLFADAAGAAAAAISAGVSFNYYFVPPAREFNLTNPEGLVSTAVMLFSGLLVSRLSLLIRRRASEAEQRRKEIEQLHGLSVALVAAGSVAAVTQTIVREISTMYGGAVSIELPGAPPVLSSKESEALAINPTVVGALDSGGELRLFGPRPSADVKRTLVALVNLAISRAAEAEERARAEAARRGDELYSAVINGLAHNFKTPLTAIKAAVSTASSGLPPRPASEPVLRDLLTVIDEETDRLGELISESLDPVRIELRTGNPRLESCSIGSVIAFLLEKKKRYLAGYVLRVDVPDELPPIATDRFLFEQMLTQVVDNAWKYSTPGSRISISVAHIDSRIELRVENEGQLIPDSEKELVFGRYYRGDRGRASMEGTGLGLPIARTIASALGGTIRLEDGHLGPVAVMTVPVKYPEASL